ncbi:MAG: TonB-dependent receptor plug domain-containing protein, partial [Nitrospinota bacterium]
MPHLVPGAAPAALSAQETEPAEADTTPAARHRLEQIRVTVTRGERVLTRLPYAVSVSTVEDLQRGERSVSLEEGLRAVPGVFVQNRRNFSLGDRVTIRGVGSRAQFGVRGIQVLADGIPLTLPDGHAVLTNLDLSSAGRVEVIRGPASALHGNAAGGVLSYYTEDFAPGRLQVGPDVTGGSHEFLSTRIRTSGILGSFGYLANFRRLETDGFRERA